MNSLKNIIDVGINHEKHTQCVKAVSLGFCDNSCFLCISVVVCYLLTRSRNVLECYHSVMEPFHHIHIHTHERTPGSHIVKSLCGRGCFYLASGT